MRIKDKIKSFARKIRDGVFGKTAIVNKNLSWHTIESGILKGSKFYGDKGAEWFEEMRNGIYDKEFFDYINKIDLKNKNIVEVGAHIGYHSLAFSKIIGQNGKVFSFEPNPFNKDRLIKNLKENRDLEKTITVLDFALSDKDGQEEFVFGDRVDKGSSSGSFLDRAHTIWEKDVYEGEKIGYKRMMVKTKTLDGLRKDGTISSKIDMCKLDVEGAEYLVLEGAKETLKKDRPLILIEVHSIFNMWKVKEIFDMNNYKLELLKEEKDGRCFFVAHP